MALTGLALAQAAPANVLASALTSGRVPRATEGSQTPIHLRHR